MARILIVDDSRTSRRMLKNILIEGGHEIIGEATDGQLGYEMYVDLKPDIVTLDITMPVLDGLGALDKIMTFDEDAKAVMITAAGQKEKMVEAIKLGATEFIQKPYDPKEVLRVLETI
ncbi:MAG: response regulator [Eubacterium sp.]|nr:response regulator [Eubacterium sp.]